MPAPPPAVTAPSILVIDDEQGILETLRILLKNEGFDVTTAQGGKAGLEQLKGSAPDIVLTDVKMPGVTGIEILSAVRGQDPETPVILMTAQASLQTAIQAVNEGAFYYIQKPFSNDDMVAICRRAAEHRRLRAENKQLKQEIRRRERSGQVKPLGKSRLFSDVLRLAEQVAPTESTVLIQGESGTGKEVIARYLHELSARTEGPFLSLNCGALPESLLESELFGHVKGSFTGAVRDKQGLFAAARGGTFFLDEIGEMSPATQVKLLRVLQEREAIPVGGTEAIPVDVRVVAATNRDLEDDIKRGRFRSDLYYRLNVINIYLPPLRDRRDDIPIFVKAFLEHIAAERGETPKQLAADAVEVIMAYDWPGNVRELENALERAVTLTKGESIPRSAIPDKISERKAEPLVAERLHKNPSLDVIEQAYITWVLESEGGNKTRAAEVLGIDPSTLYRKLSRYEGNQNPPPPLPPPRRNVSGVPAWLHGERRLLAEACAVAFAVAIVHLLFRLSAGFLTGALNDDGVYVVLGKAIAQGEGYRSIHLVGAPVQVRYPPGLPLLLAIPWALGGGLGAVRDTVAVLNLLTTAAAAGLIWCIGRRRLGVSPLPLAVCAVSPFVLDGTIQYYNIPLSEPYLVLGWAAALVLAYPLLDPATPWGGGGGRGGGKPVVRAALVGLVLAATTLFRSAAIALVPAVLVAFALHRRWRAAAACAAASLVPLAVWGMLRAAWIAQGPVSSVPDDLGYWRWLGVDGPLALAGYAGRTMATNAVEYVPKLASYLFSSQPIGVGIVGIASAAVALACVRLWRAHTALVATTLAASALTLLWPFAQGRLLLPLLPFLGLLAAGAAQVGIQRLPPRFAWGAPAALGLVALAVTLRQVELRAAAARAYETGVLPPPEDLSPTLTLAVRSRFIYQVAQWVRAYTAPEDRIMVDAPAAVYLYTGRRTVAAQPTESRLASSVFGVPGRYLAERLLADSVTVVVWAPGLEQDVLTIARSCPRVLERDPSTLAVYFRVTRDETCLRDRVLAPEAR